MEQHGLDQVIAELKSRGVKAGQEEADRIVGEAREKAQKILADARAEAEALRKKAEADRAALRAQLDAELAQAAKVGLSAFRQAIERSFLVPEVDAALKEALGRPSFLEEALVEMVKAFAASGMKTADLEVLLPERKRQELGSLFVSRLAARGAQGVSVKFDDSLSFGFKLGPKGGGFVFDLTDDGFREIFVRFLSPRFREAFTGSRKGGEKAEGRK